MRHWLNPFKEINLPWRKTKLLNNIYEAQLKKIEGAIKGMHEDLQYDYRKQVQELKHAEVQ